MAINGIITGDIIGSSHIPDKQRELLLKQLHKIGKEVSEYTPLKLELFRGDSFQIRVERAEKALWVATLFRAGLQMKTTPDSIANWDARLAIGIGTISFNSEHVVTSDGEAFNYSGHEFDGLGKRNMGIRSPWEDFNSEFFVSTAFADDIISNWTTSQSLVIYHTLLTQKKQREIATDLNTSYQNISKLLSAGKTTLIQNYITRYEQVVTAQLAKL